MKEKSDYQHIILHSVGTKGVGICISKQLCSNIEEKHVRNKHSRIKKN